MGTKESHPLSTSQTKGLLFKTKPKSKFNFEGIKEISNHPYLSCICQPSDQREILNIHFPHKSPTASLQSLAKQYLAFKEKESLSTSHSQNIVHISYQPTCRPFLQMTPKPSDFNSDSDSESPSCDISIIEPELSYRSPHISLISAENENSIQSICLSKSMANSLHKFILTNNKNEFNGIVYDPEEEPIDTETTKDKEVSFVYLDDKRKYYGGLTDGLPDGKGKEIWKEGSVYEGNYSLGMRTGPGQFVWPDGSSYKGNFLNNEMDGYGVYMWSNGNKYEGMWLQSQMHGEGKFTWSNGNQYIGQYVNGLKHGTGNFIWADGRLVKSKWFHGKIQVNI